MKRIYKILIVIAALGLAFVVTHLHIISTYPVDVGVGEVKTVTIPRGTNFANVAKKLKDAGLIRDVDDFLLVARLMRATTKAKAGEYELKTSMGAREIINALERGEVMNHPVTIPEGYNLAEIAGALVKAGIIDEPTRFVELAKDSATAASLGIESITVEGFLFPDTYNFTRDMDGKEVISAMVERFKAVYYPGLDTRAKARGMNTLEVVTLASIIEKETGAGHERPLISAVFHNRLAKKIRLQSDPTVIYGIKDFDGNLTKKHLQTRAPYNTYRVGGLPPTPIASPGRASLEAAIEPAKADYIYFVSRNDGTHHFSTTLREHINAVNKYQKRGR
ncbi:MAG: endolytic transglycosylase MltG [Proteobacteria bacterium]|nr:endolytic transglycosylase MltG [Pseudomonadota bacterium]